jgi:1-acyl-sn-glycerol-3-phosphate acyltransferase
MRLIVRFFFWLFGWKIDKNAPVGVKKCVVIMGPHTSNWDFVLGKMAFISYKVNTKYLVKKSLFFFPFGFFLKRMGGIPVDRSKANNLTTKAGQLFVTNDSLFLVFTPEGTRSYNPIWKKGFYYIAMECKVPIYIAYVDYENKIGGFHSLFEPTGDIKRDIHDIKLILSQYKGKYPEKGIKAE